MRLCAFNRGIDHAMHFLAATTTRAVSADANVAFDTTPATLRTLAVTLVTRSDAATVQLATISVCHLLHDLVLPQLTHFVERFFALLLCMSSLFFALFLECGNLIGIARSSACDLRISRIWFLKTFQSVSRALFNNTSCFNVLSWNCCRTMHMFMLAVMISPKCFSNLRTSRSKSANHT